MNKEVKNHNPKAATNPKVKKTFTKQTQEEKKALAELRKLVMAELGLR